MKKYLRLFACILMTILLICSLSACKASKKKVLESEYYKELETKYKKSQKEIKKLKKQIKAKNQPTEDEKRAHNFLKKISRDSIEKLEIGYFDNMEEAEYIDNKIAFKLAINLANRADLTNKYTAKQIKDKFECIYQYNLYDEDNAVYEILVYDGDYMIFSDMPKKVYYCYNASVLGDAFLHYKNGYPDSKLLHRLSDSALVVKSDKEYFEKQTAQKAGIMINAMEHTPSSEGKAVKYWKENAKTLNKKYKRPSPFSLKFYHHGNELKLNIYDEFISIRNMDDTITWFQVSKEDTEKMKKLFE